MIQPIIAMPESQRVQVEALVKYCNELDGTEIKVIEITKKHDEDYMRKHPGASFDCLPAASLRHCSKQVGNNPFFWLEADSPPLKPGWLKKLTNEYEKQRKPFLLSSDSNPPHDLVGGIGFYPPETSWIVPDFFKQSGWDMWLIRNLPELIAKTHLIQHCYGVYDERGFARPLIFPSDDHFVRRDAIVFHRDRYQGLMKNYGVGKKNVFLHTGDLGDIISSLPVMRHLGGGKLIITDHDPRSLMTLRPMKPRFHLICELIASQPYITSVEFSERPEGVTHDFKDFRRCYSYTQTLTDSHAHHFDLRGISMAPWITAPPDPLTKDRIIACRSLRYHNPSFPWAALVNANRNRILFSGLDEEYAHFCRGFGHVDRIITPTLLDVAKAISGSSLFIGNQSSPCWIAMGLGHPIIQETNEKVRDSMVLRPNAQFVHDGRISLPTQLGGVTTVLVSGKRVAFTVNGHRDDRS